MENGTVLSIVRCKKQQASRWLKMMWSLRLYVCCYFSTLFVICRLCPTFAFIFNNYYRSLHLCWTHVLWCGFSCTSVLMNYKQEVGQEMKIKGVLWRIIQSFNRSKMCWINKWLVFFLVLGEEFRRLALLLDSLILEVMKSTMPLCLCKHESSCKVWFRGWWLGDDEKLKGFQEWLVGILKLCMCCFTVFVCCSFVHHVKAPWWRDLWNFFDVY